MQFDSSSRSRRSMPRRSGGVRTAAERDSGVDIPLDAITAASEFRAHSPVPAMPRSTLPRVLDWFVSEVRATPVAGKSPA